MRTNVRLANKGAQVVDIHVPILIVGGGASGLSSSISLSNLGVDHLLIERHPTTSHAPKAHILNQRTMEIFRQLGIDDLVYGAGSTGQHLQNSTWRTSLGGDEPGDGRVFAQIDAWGGGELREIVEKTGPNPPCSCHQIKLEPLMHAHAAKVAPRPLLFNHEAGDLQVDDEGVTVTVTDRESGQQTVVRADYLVAADAGRSIAPAMGIGWIGATKLQDNVSIHFKADLSDFVEDGCILNWIVNLGSSDSFGLASGVLVPVGRGGLSSDWVMHFAFPPDAVEVNEEVLTRRMRSLLKLPDLSVEVHQVNHWVLESVITEAFQSGRVFMVGDAAHKHPPTIGIGMNSAFGDTSNLMWKLAWIVKGLAEPRLLESYEPERRPVIQRNIDCANTTYYSHMIVNTAIGLMPGMDEVARKQAFDTFFADNPEGERRRARAQTMIESVLKMEFQAMALELGYEYVSEAICFDGRQPIRQPDPTGCDYVPLAEPGHRMPHAWFTDGQGARRSTLDMTGAMENFSLFIGPNGAAWEEVVESVGQVTGVPLVSHRHDRKKAENSTWWEDLGLADDECLLVRPDNHIVWRGAADVGQPEQRLTAAIAQSIGRW